MAGEIQTDLQGIRVDGRNDEPDPERNAEPDPELYKSIFNDEESPGNTQQETKIRKVPTMVRINGQHYDCFEPHVVSIGPYHHGKERLEEVEKLKPKLARQYVNGSQELYGSLYHKVKGVSLEAKEKYEIVENDDKKFIKMMFLDGCFILQFIYLLHSEDYQKMGMTNKEIAEAKRDLLLLENQLPYTVLEALMKTDEVMTWLEPRNLWETRIKKFISDCRRLPPTVKPWWWFEQLRFGSQPKGTDGCLHLLDMIRSRFVKEISGTRTSSRIYNDWYSYHSAKVLKSRGIKFKPNKTGSFSDVRFRSCLRGVLTLPPLFLDTLNKTLLLNLLALEATQDSSAEMRGVTSYVCFMDSLIDTAEDVMILRSNDVIINCLGEDQQVADLFNDIANNLTPNPHIYAQAMSGIQKHCTCTCKKWIADLFHTHCRNPWTFAALCGAIFAITLTMTQTFLAAMPPKN